MGLKFIGTGDGRCFGKRYVNGMLLMRPAKEYKLGMVEHVADAGVFAVVCAVRGNVYQLFENQLHVEESWRGSPSQEISSDLWHAKINYLIIIIIHIPCIKNIVHIILKNCILS
jgi:hypothetical protein